MEKGLASLGGRCSGLDGLAAFRHWPRQHLPHSDSIQGVHCSLGAAQVNQTTPFLGFQGGVAGQAGSALVAVDGCSAVASWRRGEEAGRLSLSPFAADSCPILACQPPACTMGDPKARPRLHQHGTAAWPATVLGLLPMPPIRRKEAASSAVSVWQRVASCATQGPVPSIGSKKKQTRLQGTKTPSATLASSI